MSYSVIDIQCHQSDLLHVYATRKEDTTKSSISYIFFLPELIRYQLYKK